YVTVISMFFAFFIGILVAIARLKGPVWLRLIARFYVSIMRGTPLLVQLFVIYYGLVDYGVTLGSLTAACLAISLNAGAFLSETFRGAIQAVPKGQSEVAYATGMSRSQTMWR
ncbi:ABC transporter permease, partial [Escherichia coli]|nr:ABC transporter permease [Escherichia coli]